MLRSASRFIAGALLAVAMIPVVRAAAEFVTADQVHIPRTVQEDIQTWVYPGLEIRAFPVQPKSLWGGCGFLGMDDGQGAFSFYKEETAMLKHTNLFATGDYGAPNGCVGNAQIVRPLPIYPTPSQTYAFDTTTFRLVPTDGKQELSYTPTEKSPLEFKSVQHGIYAIQNGVWKRIGYGFLAEHGPYTWGNTMQPFGAHSVGWIAEDGRLFIAQVTDFSAIKGQGVKELPYMGLIRNYEAAFPFRFEGNSTVYEERYMGTSGRFGIRSAYVEYKNKAAYLAQHPEDGQFTLVQTLPKELSTGFTYCTEASLKKDEFGQITCAVRQLK